MRGISVQYLISRICKCLTDLLQLFLVPCFHLDLQKTADYVRMFAAGIMTDLDHIGAAVGDDG